MASCCSGDGAARHGHVDHAKLSYGKGSGGHLYVSQSPKDAVAWKRTSQFPLSVGLESGKFLVSGHANNGKHPRSVASFIEWA